MRNKEQNLTQAGAVLLFSAIIVKIIGAVFKIPLSADYVLGDLGFGYFSAVYDLYIPVYTLALSGFPVAIAKIVADFTAKKDYENVKKTFLLSYKVLLCLGVIGAFAFLSLIPIFSMKGEGDSIYSYPIVALSVFFCCVISVYRGYFEGLKNMVPTAVSSVIEALCKLLLGLSGAFVTMRLTNDPAMSSAVALAGITVGSIISCVYLKLTFKYNNRFNEKVSFKTKVYDSNLLKNFITILIPVAVASLAVGMTAFIDSLTLIPQLETLTQTKADTEILLKGTLYSNINPSEIPTLLYGIKGKAHTLFNLVPTLTTSLGVGAVPLIAGYFVEGNAKELKGNISLCLKYSALLCMPIAFGFIFVGGGITELLYGAKSVELGGRLLSVYGIAALFGGLSVPTTSVLQAVGKQRNALWSIIAGIIVKILCNVILTPIISLNIYSAAIGTSLCFAVIFALNIIWLIKDLGVCFNAVECFIKPLFASVLCGVTAYVISGLMGRTKLITIVSIAVAGVVYLLIVWFLKIIRKNELVKMFK